MTDQYLVPIEDIETRGAWRLSRADIELNGEVRADWAGRPSVPAETAARLYVKLVELRDIEARRWKAAAEEQIAAIERAYPVRGGIPAVPGLNASGVRGDARLRRRT